MNIFLGIWISPGSESTAKDSVEKHVQTAHHLAAVNVNHARRSQFGGARYHTAVLKNMSVGLGLNKMCEKDKEIMRLRFNAACYLAKRESSFADFEDLLVLIEKNTCPNIEKVYRNDNFPALFTECTAKVIKNETAQDIVNANF